MRTEFLCVSVLRVASGPRVKLVSCKSVLNPPMVYSTDRSKAVVPVLLTLCCFVVYSIRRFVVCLSMCHFVLVFFSPLSIAVTSLGEKRANLSGFRTFVRFVLVWICRFPLPLGVWEGLRFVIVTLPGLFSYHILECKMCTFLKLSSTRTLIPQELYKYIQTSSTLKRLYTNSSY